MTLDFQVITKGIFPPPKLTSVSPEIRSPLGRKTIGGSPFFCEPPTFCFEVSVHRKKRTYFFFVNLFTRDISET